MIADAVPLVLLIACRWYEDEGERKGIHSKQGKYKDNLSQLRRKSLRCMFQPICSALAV